MPPDAITFSIVTPTLNRLAMLKEAVESVRRQRWPRVEHLIVDGGSNDGTREWVDSQSDLVFLPPPDRGVYDAMNKGIAAASGGFVGLLNSDDLYEDGAFCAVAEMAAGRSDADIVAGVSRLVEGDRVIATYDGQALLEPTARSALVGHCLPNPRFFRREALRRVGQIDTTLGLVADRDLLVRLIEADIRTVSLNVPVYVYRRHEGSLTFDANLKLSRRLRHELVRLGRRWRYDMTASPATRAAGCELEGRQLLMLALAALRAGKSADAAELLLREEGKRSGKPLRAVMFAAFAALKGGMRPHT